MWPQRDAHVEGTHSQSQEARDLKLATTAAQAIELEELDPGHRGQEIEEVLEKEQRIAPADPEAQASPSERLAA